MVLTVAPSIAIGGRFLNRECMFRTAVTRLACKEGLVLSDPTPNHIGLMLCALRLEDLMFGSEEPWSDSPDRERGLVCASNWTALNIQIAQFESFMLDNEGGMDELEHMQTAVQNRLEEAETDEPVADAIQHWRDLLE
jgi:hypothetical protein